MRRLAGAIASLFLLLVVAVGGIVIFLLGTTPGQDLVRSRAEMALANLMGPRFVTRLGEQTYQLRRDGSLAVTWSDVSMALKEDPSARSEIDHFGVAVRLVPLISGGGLEFGRFEVSGARIDLNALILPPTEDAREPAPPEVAAPNAEAVEADPPRTLLARTAGGILQNVERHLGVLRSFHFDTVAFNDISITGIPRLDGSGDELHVDFAELRRSDVGALQLVTRFDLDGLPVSMAGDAEFSEETGLLSRLNLGSGRIQVADVFPPAPEEDAFDERPFGADFPLELSIGMSRASAGAPLQADASVRLGKGALQLGLNRTEVEAVELNLRYRSDTEEIELLASPMAFRDVSFTALGTIEAAPAGQGLSLDRLAFRLRTQDLTSTVGSGGEHHGKLAVSGIFDPGARHLELSEGRLETDEGVLSASAEFGYGAPEAMTRLDVSSERMGVASVKAFWPFNIAGRARHWVISHMGDAALATNARIRIDARLDRLGSAFGKLGTARPDEFTIDLDIDNADLSTVGSLPGLYNANGRLETRGSTTRVMVADAMVDGLPEITLSDSTVELSKPRTGYRRDLLVDLSIKAAGSVPQLLDIAARPPLNALRALDIEPREASGTGSVAANARLRVGRYVEPSNQLLNWAVEARIDGASPGSPIEGRRFEGMTGSFSIKPGLVTGRFDARMDSIPSTVDLSIPFGEERTGSRRIAVAMQMNDERVSQVVPALAGIINGDFTLNAELSDGPTRLSADLTNSALQIPTVAWSKGKGVAASLKLSMVETGDATRLDDIRLEGEGFSAVGSAVTDKAGLRSADLSQLALNSGDKARLKARRTDAGYAIDVSGEKFDARAILQDLKSTAGQDRTGKRARGSLDIVANVDRLGGFNGVALQNFAMNYASRNGRLTGLSLSAIAGDGQIAGDLSKRNGQDAISLSSANVGALLAFSGLYANMKSGGALLELSGTTDSGYAGRLQLRDFTLVDEPRLERIVGSTPVQGQSSLSQALGQDLRTSQAYFDQASAQLSYAGGALRVSNGIVRGPVFGSSFEGQLYDRQSRIDITGSFMPAYGINRVFGALPLVGQILGNGNEGGLIGITYRLSGPFGSPTLTVNPISLIAPGIFRQIFSYE